jgi:8-amino-7-oxononanoate synthase
MSHSFSWLCDKLDDLDENGLVRRRRSVTPLPDGNCEVDGRLLRNFASNDYLALAHDRRLIEAACAAAREFGAGARASALVAGRTPWHERLEHRLAEFENKPDAVLFPTGYAANVGALGALVGDGDALFSDRLNHASLVDACRLSGAERRIYAHADMDALKRELESSAGFRRRFIVTDGLFSMDGDAARLVEICDLAERFDAAVIVDEAHATGVFGENGRGVAEWLNVEDRVAVRTGTLSKSIGAMGGFVAGDRALIEWLWNRARTQIYSTALPPSICAAACAAIAVIQEEPWRRARLSELGQSLRQRLRQIGQEGSAKSVGPVVPVVLNEADLAVAAAAELEKSGFLVAAIRPPTVPAGTSRLRISLCSAHTQEDVVALVESLARAIRSKRQSVCSGQ